MKMTSLSVEMASANRFNDKGLETHKASPVTRVGDNGTTYHVYTSDVPEAEAADFATTDATLALGKRLLADLYQDHDTVKTPLDALAWALNRNQLRLAYGDWIKGQQKTGVNGRNIVTQAFRWMIADKQELMVEYTRLLGDKDDAGNRPGQSAADEWIVQQFIASRKA